MKSIGSEPVRFQNLTKLLYLEVTGIKLDRILNTTFLDLPSLRNVFIKKCNLEYIEDGAFQGLKNLKYMSLENNPISQITSETFKGLENLETLNMPDCKLTFLSELGSSLDNLTANASKDEPFKYLTKLKSLDLSGNKVVHASPELFQNLPNLCYLNLSNNPIESWNTRLFPTRAATIYESFNPNETCFFELFINNANVQFIKDAMLEDFLRVFTIDFSNNDLVCDIGACGLRDLIASSLTTYKQTWINSENYKCKDFSTGNLINISNLKDESCQRSSVGPGPSPNPVTSSSGVTTLISVTASLSFVTAVIIILAYRNKAHLRYFWFSFKLNVMPIARRKSKLSTMEDPSSTYDYDVFISYHHEDSKFIEEVFLPEIELQETTLCDKSEADVFEAKNLIYLIENDEFIKNNLSNNNNNNNVSKKPFTQRFKVCLHERDFAAGVPITENIVDCVDRSRKTVIFVSRKYMESQWCSFELNLTYHHLVELRRKSFVLVLMEEIPTELRSKVLNFLMASRTYLHWPGTKALEEEKAIFWKRLRTFLQSS